MSKRIMGQLYLLVLLYLSHHMFFFYQFEDKTNSRSLLNMLQPTKRLYFFFLMKHFYFAQLCVFKWTVVMHLFIILFYRLFCFCFAKYDLLFACFPARCEWGKYLFLLIYSSASPATTRVYPTKTRVLHHIRFRKEILCKIIKTQCSCKLINQK